MSPHPTPGWGRAPALHFPFDRGLSLFGRRWLVSPAGAGIDFRTNYFRYTEHTPATTYQGATLWPHHDFV